MNWPPDFDAERERRETVRAIINSTETPRETAAAFYGENCARFVRDCCVTYDPRNPARGLPAKMPFIPFPKQNELIDFLLGLTETEDDGLIEKSRDMGATWICAAVSVWLWLYRPGSAVGWGSRKEQLVDKLGDPDSIFEKIRMIIRHLPPYCIPEGFSEKKHLSYMKCINPANDSTITGEAGDNIGRGGRSSIYFKDESAHYERPELIEAALGDNTNVQVDISSVNGEGNIFHKKRFSGSVKVFVMDWSDHPGKDAEWYEKRKTKAEAQGLKHIFAQEVDRDYAAAVGGLFIPAEWARACKDAHKVLGIAPSGRRRVGQDVADEGADKNARVAVHGQVVTDIDQWAEGDTGVTTKRTWSFCVDNGYPEFIYDSIGVGAGVKAKTNELAEMPEHKGANLDVWGFSAGAGVTDPDVEFTEGKKNRDMFANAKAQAWWILRERCHDTFKAVVEGKPIPEAQVLSIPSELPYADELISELSRPKLEQDEAGKIRVEPKRKMKARNIPSPNLADALVMCFAPRQDNGLNLGNLLKLAIGSRQ